MKPKVYVETTSSLPVRSSNRDVVIAGHQQVTHEWWQGPRHNFDVVSSQLVVREAGVGDVGAANERLALLADVPLLAITEEALALAQHLIQLGAVPAGFPEDALHIAVAVVNGVEYLLTWNYRHLANAVSGTGLKLPVVKSATYRSSSVRQRS
jgi:hypothetical protein